MLTIIILSFQTEVLSLQAYIQQSHSSPIGFKEDHQKKFHTARKGKKISASPSENNIKRKTSANQPNHQ